MIQEMGIFGHALLRDLKLPMMATRDVGNYAAQRLLDLDCSGKQTRELLGERDLSMAEATAIIARGIGKPDRSKAAAHGLRFRIDDRFPSEAFE